LALIKILIVTGTYSNHWSRIVIAVANLVHYIETDFGMFGLS